MSKYKILLCIIVCIAGLCPIVIRQRAATDSMNLSHHEKKEKEIIEILILGDLDISTTTYLLDEIQSFYGVRCYLAYGSIPNEVIVKSRGRYSADSLIEYLKRAKHNDASKILGIIDKDICTTANGISDWGIFGLGFCPGSACIISSVRLQGSKQRLLSVAIHELGHNYGLSHCSNRQCVMTGGDNIPTKIIMCESCKRRIAMITKKNFVL